MKMVLKNVHEFYRRLEEADPNPKGELYYVNDYTLLVDQDGSDTCTYSFNRNDQTSDTTVQLTNSGC